LSVPTTLQPVALSIAPISTLAGNGLREQATQPAPLLPVRGVVLDRGDEKQSAAQRLQSTPQIYGFP
jgi:hypothetical protein